MIEVMWDGRDHLVKAESGMRERLTDEGFTILGTIQKDAVDGIYFRVTKGDGMKAVPFKDNIRRKKPLRWWEE